MMANEAAAQPAYENPLIPNARLRQMHRAMTHARMLASALPHAQRAQTAGLEACLVSTSADLGQGDLVSDTQTGAVVDLLRGADLRAVLRHAKFHAPRSARAGKPVAAVGRLPAAPSAAERIWMALGSAASLQAAAAHAKAHAKETDEAAKQSGVVTIYAQSREIPTAIWRKVLSFAAGQHLPVIFVVLPPPRNQAKKTTNLGTLSDLALRCGVPGVPVDADDAVAVYRVAQESIGHARIGGGPALMECVPFVIPSAKSPRNATADAIAGLESYMLHRGVVTRSWMQREAKAFAKRVANAKQLAVKGRAK